MKEWQAETISSELDRMHETIRIIILNKRTDAEKWAVKAISSLHDELLKKEFIYVEKDGSIKRTMK